MPGTAHNNCGDAGAAVVVQPRRAPNLCPARAHHCCAGVGAAAIVQPRRASNLCPSCVLYCPTAASIIGVIGAHICWLCCCCCCRAPVVIDASRTRDRVWHCHPPCPQFQHPSIVVEVAVRAVLRCTSSSAPPQSHRSPSAVAQPAMTAC